MMFDLVYTNRAVKDIKKLPADIKKRIGPNPVPLPGRPPWVF